VNFSFICSNIPAVPAYGVYISQMIRYSRACGSYQDFRDRGLLLTGKLLNQGFLLVKLKSSLITGFVTRMTRRVSLVEQKLPTLSEHLRSPLVFSGIRVTRSLVLYVCFGALCLSFCTFSFGHCVVCSSSIYGFWLPLWYLLTLLNVLHLWVHYNVDDTLIDFWESQLLLIINNNVNNLSF
jgi:hypothetical protein